MFWKKDPDRPPEEDLVIDFDLDRRSFYRVIPDPARPVQLQIGPQLYQVQDISAGGLSFRVSGVQLGERLSAVVRLPSGVAVPVIMTVVKTVPGQSVACEFVKMKEDGREALHLYVLERQKEDLERQRG